MKHHSETEIMVYTDWFQLDEPQLVGKLWFSTLRGKSVYAFEYDLEWIKIGISIDPTLPLFTGKQYAGTNENFGVFKDSSPDRWGQLLMKRRELLLSKIENRLPRAMYEIDYLLGVHDNHRMGGLRFKVNDDSDFRSSDAQLATPPWASLRDLEYAVKQYEKHAEELDVSTLKWINQLIAPGSSLGGARPKADVLDSEGRQWIAKFPSNRDDSDVGLWEMVVHELARMAGIKVPNALVKKFGSSYHTFLSQRFDRTLLHRRVHFASAMTLLNRLDGDDAESGVSYLDLVSFIKSDCTDVSANLEELFRRVLFSVCVSNTDDHLRNHGFLYMESGWVLSPAYDINANETGTCLKLNIDEQDNSLDIQLVMQTAPHYLISEVRAEAIMQEVIRAVSHWRDVAAKFKLSKSEVELKARAFRV